MAMGARVIDIHTGAPVAPPEPPAWVSEHIDDAAYMASAGVSEEDIAAVAPLLGDRPDGALTAASPGRNIIDWAALQNREPPAFEWLLPHWLSWHPTLLSGRGGIGKSLIAQQIATGLACNLRVFATPCQPVRVLYWACEDDADEIWRRQARICKQMGIPLSALGANLIIDARLGLENTLYSTEYGRPTWTSLIGELQQQVNDYRADVLLLDNIGQTFGADENRRHDVTAFVNGIMGLARGRKFCPVIMGHPAKAAGSEFAGNAAWENAVRMRWFLGDALPDQKPDEDAQPDESVRYLCKRKANYSRRDYIEFRFSEGVLIPQNDEPMQNTPPGVYDHLREKRADELVTEGLRKLAGMGKTSGDVPGPSYLPKQLVEFKLADGYSKREIEQAMRRLMTAGSIKRAQVGQYANRTPKFGLVEC